MSKETPNRMTQISFFKLAQAIKSSENMLKVSRPSHKEAAQMFEKTLGMQVSSLQVARAAKAAGVSWERPAIAFTKNIGRNTRILASAIRHLYEQLATPVPPEIIGMLAKVEMWSETESVTD